MPRDLCSIRAKNDKKEIWKYWSLSIDMKYASFGPSRLESASNFLLLSNMLTNLASGEVVLKQTSLAWRKLISTRELGVKPDIGPPGNLGLLSEAFDSFGEFGAEYAKIFYLGTLLMTPERRRAIWAIYVTKCPILASSMRCSIPGRWLRSAKVNLSPAR